ncbi:S-layer homology domain-containing protein [Bacillus ndiopicus]|uniref:S-layer homology domain-containing protein n=1 Tax=Bacillus ndiopicus TaxID=1347368 RepID=UPI0005AB3EC7|nr:S-layer homology domain-containing protein [Bacillus ndiopicus]
MKKKQIATALLLSASVAVVVAPVGHAADATDKEKEDQAKKQADEVIGKIKALTNSSTEEQVKAARQAYNALSDEARALVNKEADVFKRLIAVEEYLKNAQEAAKKKAQADATAIEAIINRLTYSSPKEDVYAAKNAYDGLSSLAKGYVTSSSYLYLTKLLQEIAKQEAAIAAAKASAAAFDRYMTNVTRQSSGTVLANARTYYNSLSYEAKQYVTTLSKLERLEELYGKNPSGPPKQPTHPNTKHEDLTGIIQPENNSNPAPLKYIPDNEYGTFVPNSTELHFVRAGEELFAYIPSDIIYYQQEPITITATNGVNIKLPINDLKRINGTVTVTLTIENDTFYFSAIARGNTINFTENVEITIPTKELKATANSIVYKEESRAQKTRVPFKIEKNAFVVKTKTTGSFIATASSSSSSYFDVEGDPNAFYINELTKRGIISGASGNSYLPKKIVTRAEFATMLAQVANLSSSNYSPFRDVRGKSYTNEIQALHEKGIMTGTGKNYYSVNGQMTRQQAAAVLDRYLAYLGVNTYQVADAEILKYTDVQDLTDKDKKSIALMDTLGIFTVDVNGAFRPYSSITRSEMAKVLYVTMELAGLL